MSDICQVPECGKPATFHLFPGNYVRVNHDETGIQTCDAHLLEGMSYTGQGVSYITGQSAPEHWRVFPIHEGSPPYCLVSCPTCHPSKEA